MNNKIYKLISIAVSTAMLFATTPVYALAANEGLNELNIVPEADLSEANAPEANLSEINLQEELTDEQLTDLDRELMAAGATVPKLKAMPEVNHEVHSLSENALNIRFRADRSGGADTFFDPRESANYLPPTRNQSPYGSCWAHSTVTLPEIQLIKSGLANTSINLSESQVVNNLYNSQLDPLGLSVGDGSYCAVSSGPLDAGGNLYFSTELVTGWQGIVSEDKDIYKYENAQNLIDSKNNTAKAYDDDYHVQGFYRVLMPRGDNPAGRTEVKELVRRNGAVGVSYYDADVFYNQGYYYNYVISGATNHAVTLVGWDDDIPATNFTCNGNTPAGNGGWLLRNSWAVTNDKDLSRFTYFWISYYDTSLSSFAFAIDVEPASNYDNNYQYDRGLDNTYASFPTGVKEANVFTAKASTGGETIKAVGFETGTTNLNYTIEVYTGLTDPANPESGTKAATTQGITSYEGFYTAKLPSPVSVNYGENFSVIVTFTGTGTIPICRESSFDSGILVTYASSNSNESFIKPASSDSWLDIGKNGNGNLRIKAYTDSAPGDVIHANNITLESSNVSVCQGCSVELDVIKTPVNATDILSWTTSNPAVATVVNGVVTGVAAGECDITVTVADSDPLTNPELSATCHVVVSNSVTAIELSKHDDEVRYGETTRLTATITPANVAKTSDIKWSSSNPEIVSVDTYGRITANGFGTATITASIGSVSASIPIEVTHLQAITTTQDFLAPDNRDIIVQWKSIPGASRYGLAYKINGGSAVYVPAEDINGNTYILRNPQEGVSYKFYLKAFSADGHDSGGYYTRGAGLYTGALHYISYALNGGTNNPSNPNYYRTGYGVTLKDASKAGFRFYGWYTDPEFKNLKREISTTSTEDYTLYAKFVQYDYTIEDNTNVVEIPRPAGYDTTSLWIDGIEYKDVLKDDKLRVTLADGSGKIATLYKYDSNGKPAGMEVWQLSYSNNYYTATHLTEFSNLLGHAGFQAKIAGENGIRCVSEINNNMKVALKTTGVNGYNIEELGICFMSQASRDKGVAFTTATVGKAISKCLYRNGSGYKDLICGTAGDMKRFAASIVGVPDEKAQYNKEIAFRSYCILSKDGQQYTIYGAPVTENMRAVVERTIATGKYAPGTSQRIMLDHILEVAKNDSGL